MNQRAEISLRDCQEQFSRYLLTGENVIGLHITGAADRRLSVYRRAYRYRLIDCLRDTFERVHAWLGDQAFEDAAGRHIERTAPSSWTLSEYGLGFDETLRQLYPNDAEVSELAWLDWALRRAFDGADAVPEPLPAPDSVDWDSATFRLLPTLCWRPMSTNCAAIWTAISSDETPPAAARLTAGAGVRVWRQTYSPNFKTIGADELRALGLAASGTSFGAMCDSLAKSSLAPPAVGLLLASWLQDGLIVEICHKRRRTARRMP